MKKILVKTTLASLIAATSIIPVVSADPADPVDSSIQQSDAVSVSPTIFANKKDVSVEGKSYQITINEEAQGKVTEATLAAIAEQAAQAGAPANTPIQINGITESDEVKVMPLAVNWYISKSNITHDNAGAAQDIISVAKGQKKSLTTTRTFSASSSIGYEVSTPAEIGGKLTAGMQSSTSATYTTSIEWSGPPESSKAISRRYLWTPFFDYGSWRADGYEIGSNKYVNTYQGNFKEAKYSVDWSMDVM